ncbi:hypothetical protein Pyrfu_1212 [Pyrolobus fumarii 1A]|uniref:Uncharacterized protein n=1 Tax=Pyrolobus fumarii (strain DSM 11204 / 1A) TaxID=694429 RepID=G0EFX3_PYRF1|nr:hypothetical protein [Pyrolobus fumarii]AEM39074.1 hypothetical protein Pyrfu_1212 [Pyrolobus fumarii 1A]
MSRTGLALLVGIIIGIGLMLGYTYRWGQPTPTTITTTTESSMTPHGPGPQGPQTGATSETTTPMGRHGGPGGPMRGTAGPGRAPSDMGMEVPSTCLDVGNGQPPGHNIMWLFNNHDVFRYKLLEFPENKTLVWIITAPSHDALEVLVSHIEQMECIVEHGGQPRPHDPLFRVDAAITSKYVDTKIVWLNDTAVKIIKVAKNDCAFEVIKLHAQVVKGFFETGRLEAMKIHEVPPEALQLCAPYLNTTSG